MPPKDAASGEEEVAILGRFGSALKIGIVGLPNVGKSTTFNVLTESEAPAENFPFCTKDPNEARVAVPDERFDFLVEHWKPASVVPAYLNVVDIAGLVKGAHEGEGLGNAFLSNIAMCDAIFHVTRAFEDGDIIHVEGEVDPVRDLDIISNELRLKDLAQIDKLVENAERVVQRSNDKKTKDELVMLKKFQEHLKAGKDIRNGVWTNLEIEYLNDLLLLTAKQVIYLVNLSQADYVRKKNKWLVKIKAWVDSHEKHPVIIPYSADFELQVAKVKDAAEKKKICEELGANSILPKIIKSGYDSLNLQSFFTAGKDEVRAWTIRKGTKAPEAAGKIHTDMERGFVMAEVMGFDDFKEAGSEANCKSSGKYRQQGRNYVVANGDIIFFKFNTAGLKKK